MSCYLDESGCDKQGGNDMMPQSGVEWALTRDYWAMLAKRYAGIFSKYLTFDLCNEFGMFGTGVYSYGDGRTETVKYCKELVNQLRAHTMK